MESDGNDKQRYDAGDRKGGDAADSRALAYDDVHDGEVEDFSWGNETTHLSINANNVRLPDVYYANYRFDGVANLYFDEPKTRKLDPNPIVPRTPVPPQIRTIVIENWGSCDLDDPIDFVGPMEGHAVFTFRQRGSFSGPVGGVSGP
ncbi:MAG TPA: hypothetical protein VGX96_20275 [Candidatus Elarobacter sp.]|jgi:hypothetical protein|nr:hypothetical protein [Candidatus Elarobacter sp.]